jgi:hypothetical protein
VPDRGPSLSWGVLVETSSRTRNPRPDYRPPQGTRSKFLREECGAADPRARQRGGAGSTVDTSLQSVSEA